MTPPEVRVIFSAAPESSDFQFAGCEASRVPHDVVRMPWGFVFFMDELTPDASKVDFDAGLYDPAAVQRFVARYRALLQAVADHPAASIGALLAMSRTSAIERALWAARSRWLRWRSS
jgi:hypothetical protein